MRPSSCMITACQHAPASSCLRPRRPMSLQTRWSPRIMAAASDAMGSTGRRANSHARRVCSRQSTRSRTAEKTFTDLYRDFFATRRRDELTPLLTQSGYVADKIRAQMMSNADIRSSFTGGKIWWSLSPAYLEATFKTKVTYDGGYPDAAATEQLAQRRGIGWIIHDPQPGGESAHLPSDPSWLASQPHLPADPPARPAWPLLPASPPRVWPALPVAPPR